MKNLIHFQKYPSKFKKKKNHTLKATGFALVLFKQVEIIDEIIFRVTVGTGECLGTLSTVNPNIREWLRGDVPFQPL